MWPNDLCDVLVFVQYLTQAYRANRFLQEVAHAGFLVFNLVILHSVGRERDNWDIELVLT